MTTHVDSLHCSIWALGRNYADHAKEMGGTVPKEPLVFLKTGGGIVPSGKVVRLPKFSNTLHHELELALRVGPDTRSISHYTLAIDLTARDLQNIAKKNGDPWTMAKAFKDSCPLGDWIALSNLSVLDTLSFQLTLNGSMKQSGNAEDMFFKPLEILNFLNDRFPIQPGDIILTGTPAGVGEVKSGDLAIATIIGGPSFSWKFE